MRGPITFAAVALALGALSSCDALHPIARGGEAPATIEAAFFQGGYGIQWYQERAAEFNRLHAEEGVTVTLWGDARVADILKPRLLRGDAPDLIVSHKLPVWLLIASNKLLPLDEALDAPLPGQHLPWRELFSPGTLDTYSTAEHTYAVPIGFNAWTWWYNRDLFEAQGWTEPRTWDEFDRLCRDIRTAGIAPIAFQGKYPQYAWPLLAALAQRIGGIDTINRMNRIEPGAFTSAAVIEAARLTQQMALDHFQAGTMAMTHTESQLQFVSGKAAMVWCGVWLYNEMKDSMPPGFEMRAFNVPAVAGGVGNPNLLPGSGAEFLYLSRDGRHPEQALAFARYLIQPEQAASMAKAMGMISPLTGAVPREALPGALASVVALREASSGTFQYQTYEALPTWGYQVGQPNLTALLSGTITPEEFCANLEAGLDLARNDPDVFKPPATQYDPARYGEPR